MIVVWLKRDLRWHDHAPLEAAVQRGLPLCVVFCFEPSLMQAPDYDVRHARFVWQSLQDMQQQGPAGMQVCILHGEVPAMLEALHRVQPILRLHSHQETGNGLSFERDKAVARWCRQRGIVWQQWSDRGIQRGLRLRKDWPAQWYGYMSQPMVPFVQPAPAQCTALPMDSLPMVQHWAQLYPHAPEVLPQLQPGGTGKGLQYLHTFLAGRAANYQRHISKPEAARTACGRLSPYLAYGCLSLRQVYQATRQRMQEAPQLRRPLDFFLQRVRWHSHFVQKFETAPRLEYENTNPGFDHLRTEANPALVEAWATGHTGYPLVDASMRCVEHTGYLNFRMRAMLVSFFTHHLWQPWQAGVHHLARLFLDYEPGIHFCQFQMQAGVTGINTIRIYNPVKQAMDYDPEGIFVKKWVPALREVPLPLLYTPWAMTALEQAQYHCRLGTDYPMPVVELEAAARHARESLWGTKKSKPVQAQNQLILGLLTHRNHQDEQGA